MSVLAAFDSWLLGVEAEMYEFPSNIAGACQEATKEIRKEIIQSWDDFRWASTDAATIYSQDIQAKESSSRGTSMVVVTDSWVDSGAFNPPRSTAKDWIRRHGGSDPQGFVLNLLMDEGIIGLPAVFAVSYYPPIQNPHFRQASTPLETHFDTSPIWQSFEARVKSKI